MTAAPNGRRASGEEIARLREALAARERGSGEAGSEADLLGKDRLPTGFEALDEALGGGLHRGALNEIYTAASGSGALEALLPAIARAGGRDDRGSPTCEAGRGRDDRGSPTCEAGRGRDDRGSPTCEAGRGRGRDRILAWIHPTRTPYPPALAQTGCSLDRWLIVRPVDDEAHLWSIDQVLRSRACAAAVVFLGELSDKGLRRLQLSAREGGAAALILRPAALASYPSPAAARIFAEPEPADDPCRRRVRMTVLRSRGTTSSDVSVVLEWSRDPLDERPSSWFADRAPRADDAGCERTPARARIA
jgi:hypothetical protein